MPGAAVPAYDRLMTDEGWSAAEKAGALLLAILAAGLLLVAADILSGGRLTGRKGCAGCDERGTGD